jgi:soluble lytic murein transglycosylase
MQVMPATARWTARKLGMAYTPTLLQDPDSNLRLGMAYLRMVLDDFDGALPLAAAAYNAGPGRPRRWREGEPIDAAAWAETIPFAETRDYVKKVLANATVYARLLGDDRATLRQRLGQQVGPRLASATPINQELP